jgi:putative cardiolipin synthase
VIAAVATTLGACAARPPGADYPRPVSIALAEPGATRLGRQFADQASSHAGASGFRIFTQGLDGFLVRAEIIEAAERTLDLQYFIFRGDVTGRLLTEGLLRAADRGVRVRVLVDDGDTLPGDEQIQALAAHALVEVRVFNPFAYRGHNRLLRALEFLGNPVRLDYRMHNKLLVVDNAMAVVGGRNIGDPYFQIDPSAQFADDDVVAVGPIACELSATFDEFWNSPLAVPAQALRHGDDAAKQLPALRQRARLRPRTIVQPSGEASGDYVTGIATGEPYAGLVSGNLPLAWATARVLFDSPDKRNVDHGSAPGHLLAPDIRQVIAATRSEWLMVTPYFIPADQELGVLNDLRERKVVVGIVTNSLQSSRDLAAHASYTNYRKALLARGVSLYEVRAQPAGARGSGQSARLSRFGHYGLHAKLMVFDRQDVFIGSMNFDQRSKRLNTEVGLLIQSPELAAETASRFQAMTQWDNAYEVTLVSRAPQGGQHLMWRTREQGQDIQYLAEPAQSRWRRIAVWFLSLLPLSREL